MHDDNNVFQLSKMECKYSEFIEIKKQLEDNKKRTRFIKYLLQRTNRPIKTRII